jgi:endonuclease YncB( thermonuclease family)
MYVETMIKYIQLKYNIVKRLMSTVSEETFATCHLRWLARKYATIWRLRICENRNRYEQFNLCDYRSWVRVVDVYDGDTLKVLMNHRGRIDVWTVRMNGYNAPEMKPLKTHPNRDEEIVKAKRAKAVLYEKTIDRTLFIRVYGFDKYGRLLAELYDGHIHINQYMVKNGYGYVYNLGKK